MLAQLIKLDRKFKPEVLNAIREFRSAKPWRGTLAERKAKFNTLHTKLCAAYAITVPLDMEQANETGTPGASYTAANGLVMCGKLSVVSYLNRFRFAQNGCDSTDAYLWAASLYVRMFPKSADRMVASGYYIVTPETAQAQGIAGTPLRDIIAALRRPAPVGEDAPEGSEPPVFDEISANE